METEIWKPVPNFGDYEISSWGQVRSNKRGECKLLKQFKLANYLGVNLLQEGRKKTAYVHHLVSMAFLNHFPSRPYITVINHIDGDRWNNRLENLELITHRENCIKGWAKKPTKSKYPGVTHLKLGEKIYYRAQVGVKNDTKYLGTFKTEEEAYACYKEFVDGLNEQVIKNDNPNPN
jgi:hypothetical protein